MCTKSSLRSQLSALFAMLIICSFVLIALGAWMIVDSDGHIAYGQQVVGWGGGYIFASVTVVCLVVFGVWGARRHNKFALSVSLCCNLFSLFVLFIVVVNIITSVAPSFSVEFANACVARPLSWQPISEECMAYFTDLGNIRLFRLWLHQYQKSYTVPTIRAAMLNVEDGGFCCGWGPPLQCMNERGGNWSVDAHELGTSSYPILDALNRCSTHPGWYQVGYYCDKVANGVAGCPYMFSQNLVCSSDTTTRGGCAGTYQSTLSGQFNGFAAGGIATLVIQLITVVSTVCYCFKRKYTDVLPPYEPFSAAEYEKYRFGVVGQDEVIKVESVDESSIEPGRVVAADGAASPTPAGEAKEKQ